jgi:flavin-dependent thymidylate synthase
MPDPGDYHYGADSPTMDDQAAEELARARQRADELTEQAEAKVAEIRKAELPVRWGDSAQYHQDARFTVEAEGGVVPKVKILSMTPDPLGVIGAMAAIYEGRVVRSLDELQIGDRERYWKQVLATHLDTPLEAVQIHFLLDGVDRAFTHQLVRQRVGAAYAQESLRFSVVGDLADTTSLPPSLAGTLAGQEYEGDPDVLRTWSQEQHWRVQWDDAIRSVNDAYRRLVDSGMPAEEARGLLPQATATRVHYVTNLRALSDHAGNRLCTQAQFVWRVVFAKIIEAIRNYDPMPDWIPESTRTIPVVEQARGGLRWQYETIADSELFRPICYKLGRCPFNADFDRACSIRDRVRRFAAKGVPSDQWEHPTATIHESHKINTAEWLANPAAARA